MRPNPRILEKLKRYDRKLDIKWNGEKQYFEVYRGKILITPVTEFVLNLEGDRYNFCPLDDRIVAWIHSADTANKKKCWKWMRDYRFNKQTQSKRQKNITNYMDAAKDYYNMVNNETINPLVDDSNFIRPDKKGTRGSVSMRSAENARRYFDDVD